MSKQKISKQQQERNKRYNEYVKEVTPTHNLWLNMLKAFLLGGFICLVGQVIIYMGRTRFDLSTDEAA
ncbi:MAG: SpoVA protein, partial [Agathobacter sp.]|nr:SpoVA protein [Agathobacter sp.]